MVGGSTRIPAVVEAVKKLDWTKSRSKVLTQMNVWQLVLLSRAAFWAGDVKGLVLLDVTPLTLGLETQGGIMARMIERNTTIPTKKTQIFTTAADGQTSVDVSILPRRT